MDPDPDDPPQLPLPEVSPELPAIDEPPDEPLDYHAKEA